MQVLMIVLQFESKNCFVLARIIKKNNDHKNKNETKQKQENSKRNKWETA